MTMKPKKKKKKKKFKKPIVRDGVKSLKVAKRITAEFHKALTTPSFSQDVVASSLEFSAKDTSDSLASAAQFEDDDDDEEEEEGLLLLLSANTVPFVFERFFFSRVLFPACLLARVVGRTVTRQSLRWWIRIDGRQTFPTDDDSESSHRRAWIARRKTRSGHRCRSGRSYAWNVPACTDRSACTSRSSAR